MTRTPDPVRDTIQGVSWASPGFLVSRLPV
jgi:hypothetical protein